ncbi:hypothetical protein Glove_86g159 [Diversispora epigaea]|uniref:Protein kinase domain-containing protein n=1 Tax=Diversispora epigaea TaxID=1348612 RepID=A0A397JHB5_9GLOM|nr:hypothetical protein Glove_86g159 [Diversispora epigaea]
MAETVQFNLDQMKDLEKKGIFSKSEEFITFMIVPSKNLVATLSYGTTIQVHLDKRTFMWELETNGNIISARELFWKRKIDLLYNVSHGLESVHGDLHSGNILVPQQYEAVIGDLELFWKRKIDLLYNVSHGLESVHGDLHSGNILVPQQYEAVIGDLGLCKSETSIDKVICSVISCMAPEVLRGDKYFWNDRQLPFSDCDGYL